MSEIQAIVVDEIKVRKIRKSIAGLRKSFSEKTLSFTLIIKSKVQEPAEISELVMQWENEFCLLMRMTFLDGFYDAVSCYFDSDYDVVFSLQPVLC